MHVAPSPALVDQFDRKITNVRVSIIDRCNLRCRYCIAEEKVAWTPTQNLLTFDEIYHIIKILAAFGIKTVRITGGEPLVRPRVSSLIKKLKTINGIDEINMTTNGVLLNHYLADLEEAQLDNLNISLDTLNEVKFQQITRRNQFHRVIKNILLAKDSKIKVKINCVALKGFNDQEILDFVKYAITHDLTVRFIEFMPFNGNIWLPETFLSAKEIKNLIEQKYTLIAEPLISTSQTSRVFKIEGYCGKIGFISSVSDTFCQWCDRVRITAEGNLRTCLHGKDETELRPLLRSNSSDEFIIETIKKAVYLKQRGHIDWIDPHVTWKIPINDREMIRIGG